MNSRNTYIICATAMFCFVLAAVVAIAIAVPDGARVGSMVTIMFTGLGATIAALAALFKSDKVSGKIDEAIEQNDKILNGHMDAKIQRNIHAVLDEREARRES